MNRHLLRSAPLVLALAVLTACGGDAEPTADTPVTAPSDTPSPSPSAAPAPIAPAAPDPAPTFPTPVSSAAIPTVFHGEWNRVLKDCNSDNNDSRLRIAADKIDFYEGGGTVVLATQEGNDLQVIVQLTQGGEVVERRFAYRLAGNRQALTDLGTGLVRLRCIFHPTPAPPPPPTTPPQA